jgi:adenylate cyclase
MKMYRILFLVVTALMGAAEIYADDFLLSVSGSWKMMRGDDLQYAMPEYDDSAWPDVTLPSKNLMPADTHQLFEGAEMADTEIKKGYVWYRKKISLDKMPNSNLLLQIREIMNADAIYFNGKQIGSSGRFPPEFRSGWSKFRSYSIDRGEMRVGENLISIRVYFDAEAWIVGPMEIVDYETGSGQKMIQDFFLNHAMQVFSFILITLFFFFVYFFIRRRQEKEYLYFALATLSLSVTIALQYFENFYPDVHISSENILRITQSALVAFPSFLSLFFHSYIFRKIHPARLVATLLFPLIGIGFMLYASDRSGIFFYRNIFLLGFPIFFIDGIVLSYRNPDRGDKKGRFFFIGLLPTILLGVHDILAFGLNVLNSSIALFVYGFPIFLIIIAGHLIDRFIRSLNEAEQLNVILRDMMESISRFVPVQFIKYLHKDRISDVVLGDAILNNMTVLFMDIRNFTKLSSQMTPEANFRFLNSFLNRMEPPINKHMGFVDKFIGDAIMALFSESSDEAVMAAIEMRQELSSYNDERSKRGLTGIDIGIGINAGEVILGTVGSANRMDTTVIGSTVNLASRIEHLTKIYSIPILITKSVLLKLVDPNRYCIREIDLIRVRGVEEPVAIYEVFDADTIDQRDLKTRQKFQFQNGVMEYRRGNFDSSMHIFMNCLHENPADIPLQIYVNRCRNLLSQPPGAPWMGITDNIYN